MLGEKHQLLDDFPDHRATINELVDSDHDFGADAQRYNALDEEIRQLELDSSPISDEEMHQKKHDRSELKDSLYQRILKAEQ